MERAAPDTRHTTLPLIAIVVTGAIGELLLYVSPLLLGSITEGFRATEGNAGLIVAAEFGASALLAFLIARRLSKVNVRALVFVAITVMVCANAIAAVTSSLSLLVMCRVLAGGGSGTVLACANATAASGARPQRTFALLTFGAVAGAFFAYLGVPAAVERFGPAGTFIALAVLTAVDLPLVFWFPANGNRPTDDIGVNGARFGAAGWLLMIALGTLYLGQNALWAYVERIAHSVGLPLSSVATVLIVNSILALGAPLLAQGWGLRSGLVVPILVGMGVQIATAVLLPHSSSLFGYSICAIVFTFGFMFVVPYVKTQMARMDGSGRLCGSAMAFMTVGSSLGPALAGAALSGHGNYFTVGWIAAIAIASSAAMIL